MDTVEAAVNLSTQIEILVAAADVCGVDVYQVTAGEPAQPTSNCSVVSVWPSQYFNAVSSLFAEDNPCLVVKGVQLNYRLDVCYPEQEADHTAAQHLTTAVCLYGLADAIWCGLNVWLAGGAFGQCSDVAHDPMTFSRDGGIVSASSSVRFQLDCTPPPVVEDVVGLIAGQQEGQDYG